ncbi:MAG: hypothetical protein JSS61_07735, partial [Verrucomicrobia bacterium]|nr:hypothetical protein [Verrucomicrobiota bacterium]
MKKGLLFLTCATSTLLYGDGWFMLREHPHRIEESIEEPPAEEGITGIALIGKADLIQPGGYERLSGIRAFG